MAGILREIWTGELLTAFRAEASFMAGIPNYSNRVQGNKSIHLVDVGVDPAVLINNSTFPIPKAGRADADISISLDKYDTENTTVTWDELHGISFDKIKSVNQTHKDALVEKTGEKSIYNIAPAGNTSKTPVFATVGATFAVKDIIAMKRKFDDANIPSMGRRLVLCPEHIEALLGESEAFSKQYSLDTVNGKVGRIMGFDVYEYSKNPVYTGTTKKAFGATAAPATDKNSSVAFFTPRMFQAQGKILMTAIKAEDNPTMRENVIGYQMYHIALPKKQEGIGAIVSQ